MAISFIDNRIAGMRLALGAFKTRSKGWDWSRGPIQDPGYAGPHPRAARTRAKRAFLSSCFKFLFCVCLLKGDVCRVQVISQCRRAEVYQGRLREYSSTVNASFVDSSEDEEGDDAMSSMIIGKVISIGVSALIAVIKKLFLRQEVPLR